jgi:polyisoprenoid-binding protein YceI
MLKKAIIVLFALAIIGGVGLAYAFFREPEAASGQLEAIPIAAEGEQPIPDNTATPAVAAGEAPTAEIPTSQGAAANEETANEGVPSSEEPPGGAILFEIVAAESEARFLIDEVLRGQPTTVVGSTDQVAGQISVDPGALSTAQVGTIRVNARTLTTDNEFRNRAIKNRILRTDDHEFVTFVPQEIVGLPEQGRAGERYTFQIVGDLTITGITRQVTFDMVVTPISETRIEGSASTAFDYADFELAIPDAQAVDTVEDVVRLEFDFVAEPIP